jgi:uncharacterized protein (TIGR04255 family)
MPIKSPIIDSIVEIVFDSNVPSQALVGIIYQEFKDDFQSIQNLPILQMPAELRAQTPELAAQPNYRLVGNDFTLSLGEGVIYIGCVIDRAEKYYPSWKVFGKFAHKVVKYLVDSELILSVTKVGVRYVNFFEETGLVDKTNLTLKAAGKTINSPKTNIYYEGKDEEKLLKVQMAGDATINSPFFGIKQGSIVDITTYQEGTPALSNTKAVIEALHIYAEDTFFDLVKTDVLPEGVTRTAH